MQMINGKPVIGVTSAYAVKEDGDEVYINRNYLEANRRAGGIPVLVPVDGTAGDFCHRPEQYKSF